MFENEPFNQFLRAEAQRLRSADRPPETPRQWAERRDALRAEMLARVGPMPEGLPAVPDSRLTGQLNRDGYRIENRLIESRPGVWITSNLYLPALPEGAQAPAVLCVHGHWAGARRDPTVQARCLGLVRLGFVVLAVDAFGAGERYTQPARGTYHGALYGASLWPVGRSLWAEQVLDNRRAVDYLLSRREVNGKLGVTGASGGGNQTMYAAALDERLQCAVPVCSVGNYQAFLKAACCVCEVLPGGLSFTEEGEVLGLIAPRALMVISASRDAIQFSPAEAAKSLATAWAVYGVQQAPRKLRHEVFDSPHDYSKPMREAMYGWMSLHLKGVGDGSAIPEPAHEVETPEALACFGSVQDRPTPFLTPPTLAYQQAQLLARQDAAFLPTHPEMWQASAIQLRQRLAERLGGLPRVEQPRGLPAPARGTAGGIVREQHTLANEGSLRLPVQVLTREGTAPWSGPVAWVLHRDVTAVANEPFTQGILGRGYTVVVPELRACGGTAMKNDAVAGAPDHNSAEHSIWLGRSLLQQWLTEVGILLDWAETRLTPRPAAPLVVGLESFGVLAVLAAAHFGERIRGVMTRGAWVRLASETPYASGTPMGLFHPGLLLAGDIPVWLALIAPRPVSILDPVSPGGRKLNLNELNETLQLPREVYRVLGAAKQWTVTAGGEGDVPPMPPLPQKPLARTDAWTAELS